MDYNNTASIVYALLLMGRRTNTNRSRRRSRRRRNQSGASVLHQIEENTRQALDRAPPLARDKLPMQLSTRRVYTIKRSSVGPTISGSTSGSTFGAANFTLAQFDSTSEIAENYQLYRIIEITVKFVPAAPFVNSIDGANTQPADFGHFHTAIDQHNDNVPISMAELEEYKTHQVVRSGQFVSRCFVPRTLGRCFGGVTDAFYAMPAGVWMSTDYSDAHYYGIKWALSQIVGLSNGSTFYTVQIDAVIQGKNTI